MKMTNSEYQAYVKKKSPKSPFWPDLGKAFLAGGLICLVGQVILLAWNKCLSQADAATATSITMIFLGAILTGLGIYDRIARFGGAGTLVPITGFANAVVAPALEFKSEGLITGTAAKIFIIAGPVIVYGTIAGVVYGLVLVLFGLT